jgi:hypothetical protein
MNLTPSLRRILMALDKHGDMEYEDIAEHAHVAITTLRDGGYMLKLQIAGKVRVSRWIRNTVGPFIPVWSTRPGENKPKPIPYTAAQKCARYKKRARYYSPEYRARMQAKKALNELLRISA